MSNAPELAAVIPVAGDAAPLEVLLRTLRKQSGAPEEIIVVDGLDDDRCRDVANAAGVTYITSKLCRGHQLAAGADATQAEWLWFLHADAVPDDHAATAVRTALAEGADGGHFCFRFTGSRRWPKPLLEHLINWRCRFGTPYGDQGIFATRAAYVAAGGFSRQPLFEEVALVRGLRQQGRFRGLSVPIGVDPRRWEREGWWRRSLMNRILALAYMAGVPAGTLAKFYRRKLSARKAATCPHP